MLRSILYASASNLEMPRQEGEIDELVASARSRNADLEVTGALLFTETRFAQVLEGPYEAVDVILQSIRRDTRHRDMRVISDRIVSAREFHEWALAYRGPSLFLDRKLKPLLASSTPDTQLSDDLADIVRELFERTSDRNLQPAS